MATEVDNLDLADEIAAGFAVYDGPPLVEYLLHVIHDRTDVSDPMVDSLVHILMSEDIPLPPPPDVYNMGPATKEAVADELMYRGLYAESALDRLQGREDALTSLVHSENIFFAAHLRMANKRVSSAVTVDTLAPTHNGVLSWYAKKIDRSTLQECRDSHLKNFKADRKPRVGWPGAVVVQATGRHALCSCESRPPIEGAEFLA